MYDKYINMESGFDMYMNSGYNNNRNRKKTLIVDFDDNDNTHLGSGTEFRINLREPLIIDKHSEIYLDNFLTFNCNLGDTHNHSAFVLKINEFNINNGVASNTSSDKIDSGIVIPNDNNNIDNYFGTVVHKGKKFNYICDINPCTLHSISGKITDLNGDPIFHGSSTGTKFTYALTGIDTWGSAGAGAARALVKGDVLSSIVAGAGGAGKSTGASTRILANTALHASSIFFTAEEELTQSEFDAVDIVFTVTSSGGFSAYTFTISTATNPSVVLLKQNARFISEFSIVSRD
tara:strand:- start:108 stop:980 length:873 start_codon:yes stop_codon:yes gene_type:complete